MEEIQNKYQTFKKWSELVENTEETDIKALKFGIKEMINEGLDMEGNAETITDKQVGRLLTDVGIRNVTKTMQEIVVESAKTEEEEEKNV